MPTEIMLLQDSCKESNMTGWNQDKETLNLVDSVVATIMSRPDLLPDTWYHISLHMDMVVDKIEKEQGGYFKKESLDHEMIKYYRADPDRLKERIEWNKKIQLAHFESIRILQEELERLDAC